jgi:LuxR family maltose regulon positive regulatory protein
MQNKGTQDSLQKGIQRSLIIDRVFAENASLILFIAPAGYGKTQTMSQLRAAFTAQGIETAWWSLERQDNDPQQLLSYLRQVLNSSTVTEDIAPYGLRTSNRKPIAIFLDDFEQLDGGPLPEIVLSLLDQLPQGSRLVIGSRRNLKTGLTKLKLQGAVVEFNAQDLQFSKTQSAELIHRGMGRDFLSESSLNLLYEKTSGWPAAVALASIALSQQGQGSNVLVHQISASLQPVAEYLSEVVLNNQPPEVYEFLISSSVLHQLDPNICKALLPDLPCDTLLSRLIDENLFVSAVPGQVERWRYHPLFADILRMQLKRKRPLDFLRLHLAAAGWYEENGHVVPAIDHVIAGEDYPYAAHLLAKHAMRLLVDGRIKLLARWFDVIPLEVLNQHSVLLNVSLWVTTFTQGALQAMRQRENIALFWPGDDPNSQIHLDALNCSWLFMLDKPSMAGAVGLKALSRMPTQEPYADNVVSISMAIYWVQEGNRAAANRLLNAARERQGDAAFMRMFIESAESEQDMQDGRLKQAMARLRIAVGATHSQSAAMDITNGNAWAGVLLGVACYEAGQWEQAKRLLSAYVPVAQAVGSHDHLILAWVCLSRMANAAGEEDEAIRCLAELEHVGATRKLPRLMASAWLERSRTQTLTGQREDASRSIMRANLPGVWDPGQTLRRVAHSALDPETANLRWTLHFGEARQALRDIDVALAHARSMRWPLRCVTLELLRAAALSRNKQESAALQQLLSTFEFCAQQGMVSRVLDEGPMVMALARKLQLREINQHADSDQLVYLSALLGSEVSAPPIPHHVSDRKFESSPSTQLTQKETEILNFLAEGYSNHGLAKELHVSESTIRTHLRNINAKLDATSRMQAVAKARQWGLLK